MNPLLQKQIDKNLKNGPLGLEQLLNEIEGSYTNFEKQITILKQLNKTNSNVSYEVDKNLEIEDLEETRLNLASVLSSMDQSSNLLDDSERMVSTAYLKKQSEKIVRLNKKRIKQLQNLEEQNQELNDYTHMVSHDLRAPLRSIDTLVNWFKQDNKEALNNVNIESLDLILSNVEKMDFIIKGILTYSSIDKKQVENKTIDLNSLIEEILQDLSISEDVQIVFQNKMPPLFGNDFILKKLFQNLIQNAIKYNDKEKKTVEIGHKEKENEFQFYIKDNGIGIEEKYQTKIFKIFSKLDHTNQSPGIGLSIVKKIIDLYNGKVWIESLEGEGSTFHFLLPKQHGAT